jgi:hypothetical protein
VARVFNGPPPEDEVEEIGGIGIAHRRIPVWLLLISVGILAWGLYYLITYSVTPAGSFHPTGMILRL